MNTHSSLETSQQAIHSLAYISRATRFWTSPEQALLEDSCTRNNHFLGITGRLLHCHGLFLQLLEGPADAVVELIHTISADHRHERVTSLFFAPAKRRYTEFRMCMEDVSREQFTAYARRSLTDLGHLSPEQAEQTLQSTLEYMAADDVSLPSSVQQVRRMPGVKLYFKPTDEELPRKTTHFNILRDVKTVPLGLGLLKSSPRSLS
jgi:hypothetical protein